jgi:hypothetical protein
MNALQGHTQGGMSDRYGGGQYPVARQVGEMAKLRHAGVDLAGLALVLK